jgi:hypothetical protein
MWWKQSSQEWAERQQFEKITQWSAPTEYHEKTHGYSCEYSRLKKSNSDPWPTRGNEYSDPRVSVPTGFPMSKPVGICGLLALVVCLIAEMSETGSNTVFRWLWIVIAEPLGLATRSRWISASFATCTNNDWSLNISQVNKRHFWQQVDYFMYRNPKIYTVWNTAACW